MCFRMSQKTKVAKSAKRTKITRGVLAESAPAATYPCVENFGDLITADNEVLREECESRNNRRYAVIVQDLSTQRLQAYPCKTKTSQETMKNLQKVFRAESQSDSGIHRQFSGFWQGLRRSSVEYHCTSTPHRSETDGNAERAECRWKEGTSATLLQSGMDEKWWADAMECYCYLRNVEDLYRMGKLLANRVSENHLECQ